MTKDAYPGLFHFIHKRMANISFPASKQQLLAAVGTAPVNVDWEKKVPLSVFIDPIKVEEFSCAADFYCALIAALA